MELLDPIVSLLNPFILKYLSFLKPTCLFSARNSQQDCPNSNCHILYHIRSKQWKRCCSTSCYLKPPIASNKEGAIRNDTFSKMVLWVDFRVSTSHCSKGEQARIHLLIKMMLHSEPLLYSVEFVHCCSLVEMPFMKGVGLSFNCGFCHSFVYEDAKINSPKTSNVSTRWCPRGRRLAGVCPCFWRWEQSKREGMS